MYVSVKNFLDPLIKYTDNSIFMLQQTENSPAIYHRLVGCTTMHPIGRPRGGGCGSILSGCGSVLSEPGLCRGRTGGCGCGLLPLLPSLLQQKQMEIFIKKIRKVGKTKSIIINDIRTIFALSSGVPYIPKRLASSSSPKPNLHGTN